ncbi:DUF317 domain-containing protein [Streptomyces flaveolus]|uniref:DUF317 domain-containing protein n=1 Tax=Streptomyces flaveolus TaxID=67297 RepID=UPI0036F4F8D4
MPHAPADAHIHFALHPDHHPGVVATASGPTADAARTHLHGFGFRSTGPDTMVLARIDREAPFYTAKAAHLLQRYGFTTEIDAALQQEIDTEWTWGNYPMPWCSREEIRAVSAAAQRIHDDIAEGRLIIHAHADDGHTTVAVGSCPSGVHRHVHLHGENHLRQITHYRDTEAEALAEFHRLYSVAVRPGPAPLTDLERTVRHVLHGKSTPGPPARPPLRHRPRRPSPAPASTKRSLTAFLDASPQWEKHRPWDETTILQHESLTARAVFDHEARHRTDTAWTIAEYDGPAGERLWHATLTAAAPVSLLHTILQHLDNPPLADATEPYEALRDAGWHPASQPARTTWQAPDQTITFEHLPHAQDDQWTVSGGDDLNRPAWALRLSAAVPHGLLTQVTAEAANLIATHPVPAPAAPRAAPVPGRPPAAPTQRARVR